MPRPAALCNIPISPESWALWLPLPHHARSLYMELAVLSLVSANPIMPAADEHATQALVDRGLLTIDGTTFKLPHIDAITQQRAQSAARMRRCRGKVEEAPAAPSPAQKPAKPAKGRTFSERVTRVYDACTWRKVGKQHALKAIERAGKSLAAQRFNGSADEAAAFLLDRATVYAASRIVKTTPVDYLPHPATWFNGGRYDDDVREWDREYQVGTGQPKPAPRRPEGFS